MASDDLIRRLRSIDGDCYDRQEAADLILALQAQLAAKDAEIARLRYNIGVLEEHIDEAGTEIARLRHQLGAYKAHRELCDEAFKEGPTE